MRTCNKEVTIVNTVEENVSVNNEEIININENKTLKMITVTINYLADSTSVKQENIIISGDNYDSLMSENPSFAPGKPENEYREADLWYIIDLIRNEITTQ